jgi:hypothetical protein
LRAFCALRMRVSMSAMGSVILMLAGSLCYQLALDNPGISPRIVASRSLFRLRPNFR